MQTKLAEDRCKVKWAEALAGAGLANQSKSERPGNFTIRRKDKKEGKSTKQSCRYFLSMLLPLRLCVFA
jgi:hypothetical protein